MGTAYSKEEADRYLQAMKEENDIVRLVDPEGQKAFDLAGNLTGEACNAIWGRCERCENCTSLRALRSKGQAYKLESLSGRTYWVCSKYMEIGERPFVAELVKDVTDRLVSDSDRCDEFGAVIRSYNQMLVTDPLTGVYNRRFLDEYLLPSLNLCQDAELTVNLAFMDIDHFKEINDRHGHSAGDALLRDTAGFWKLHFESRKKGAERYVVRYGGDEFLVIANGISQEQFAKEIRLYYEQMRRISYLSDGTQLTFELTYGIASSAEAEISWDWNRLIETADRRMYEAKADRKKLEAAQKASEARPTVMVVEDNEINRDLLRLYLDREYDVVEAENGSAALEVLKSGRTVTAILLDIIMPVMDGYTFLKELQKSPYSSLPVIVMTGEKDEHTEQKALDLGAWDFVSKPYQPATLLTRLKNVIVRSEFYLVNEMKRMYEHDSLTNLYNRTGFFSAVRKMLNENRERKFAMVRFDLKHFQTYNSFWGEEEGDRLLRFMAETVIRCTDEFMPSTCGRITADTFCVCCPYEEEPFARLGVLAEKSLSSYNPEYRLEPVFGIYIIENNGEPIENMYEKATMAARNCKRKILPPRSITARR